MTKRSSVRDLELDQLSAVSGGAAYEPRRRHTGGAFRDSYSPNTAFATGPFPGPGDSDGLLNLGTGAFRPPDSPKGPVSTPFCYAPPGLGLEKGIFLPDGRASTVDAAKRLLEGAVDLNVRDAPDMMHPQKGVMFNEQWVGSPGTGRPVEIMYGGYPDGLYRNEQPRPELGFDGAPLDVRSAINRYGCPLPTPSPEGTWNFESAPPTDGALESSDPMAAEGSSIAGPLAEVGPNDAGAALDGAIPIAEAEVATNPVPEEFASAELSEPASDYASDEVAA